MPPIIFGIFFVTIVEGLLLHHPLYSGSDKNISIVNLINGFPNVSCDFQTKCSWQWSEVDFTNITGVEVHQRIAENQLAPSADADGNQKGRYLYVFDTNERKKQLNLTSPSIDPTYFDKNLNKMCTLTFALNTNVVPFSNISVLIREGNRTKVIDNRVNNDVTGYWQIKRINLGHPEEKFQIIIEIGGTRHTPSYVAVDNIALENCFPDVSSGECPLERKFQCDADKICIPLHMVCDIRRDCSDAADEKQGCDEVPAEARCTFEHGWCGWHNATEKHHALLWKLNHGTTRSQHTGPSFDNTFGNLTGTYAFVDMSSGTLGSLALIESAEINPPPPLHGDVHSPYYNSCYISFFYHKYGPHSGSLGLYYREQKAGVYRNSYRLWWSYGNKGDVWLRQVVVLPNITERYKLQFEARKSMSSRGDVAIDDISFSPKCFGKGIPKEELGDYDYYEYPKKNCGGLAVHEDFVNETAYVFTTCGSLGSEGPTADDCQVTYMNTTTEVTVIETEDRRGIQKWRVPETSYYTIIAKGARGGKGSDALGESKAAVARVVTELYKDQIIYFLVGQEGQDACKKLSLDTPSSCTVHILRTNFNFRTYFNEHRIENGGGGGGGATYIFTIEQGDEPTPILVVAGGGGLAHGPSFDTGKQHGNGINSSLPAISAPSIGHNPAGGGGGWRSPPRNIIVTNSTGKSLLEGGQGGISCYISDGTKGNGGFGGGGGGCVAGGGGGGYTGGRAWSDSHMNGEGGWSMIAEYGQYKEVQSGIHYGPGSVIVIPSIRGCGCEHRCVALDELRTITTCICAPGWILKPDNASCALPNMQPTGLIPLFLSVVSLLFLSLLLIIVSLFLYNRYQQQKTELTQRKICGAMQMNNFNSGGVPSVRLTEFNPNYEFGGVTYTIRDLKEIPREKVQLVKPLGCGAFGDVYQGLLRNRDTDSVDMAVAVKILPALSSNQAEADFLMEALIMSKFNHPNIVHFIGACFDTHPRYIILELLAGGDLKNFLRENRPKVDKPSSLTMKDLLQCAIDVAKGCQYLEELHFIHRDIAARNCLLSSRGPGRVAKIADFGMSRDIYRSDYYKKGGRAMLPIKWMPPEAFLDGIFSSKTDVWSFGVLLWEVMSLGFMPYTGIRNRDVMHFVARGARLGAPANCPSPVFAIMGACWSHDPNERPNFATIVERLGYCIQDPLVTNTQLPVYKGPLPSEIDKTIMRPPKSDDYIQADYMIPIMPDTPVEWKEGEETLHKYLVEHDRARSPARLPLECMSNFGTPPLDYYVSPMPNGNTVNEKDRINVTAGTTAAPHGTTEADGNYDNSKSDFVANQSKPFTLSGNFVPDSKISPY